MIRGPDPLLAEMQQLATRDRVPIAARETGRLLETLVIALQPKLVVEVGTAIGYSTLQMARALGGDGRLVTLERDPDLSSLARGFFARDPAGARIDLVEGDALETLQRLRGPFGLAFVDATRSETARCLTLLEGELAPRALVAIDGLQAGGELAGELMTARAWSFSVLPVGDGMGLGARRATVTP